MTHYSPHSDVVSTELDDQETVLLSLETQQYYSLNETGRRIWEHLSRGNDAQTIARALSDEWDVAPNEALASVRRFLRELADEGLLETDESGVPATGSS